MRFHPENAFVITYHAERRPGFLQPANVSYGWGRPIATCTCELLNDHGRGARETTYEHVQQNPPMRLQLAIGCLDEGSAAPRGLPGRSDDGKYALTWVTYKMFPGANECEPEVTELEHSSIRGVDVLRLDVEVRHLVRMHEGEPCRDLRTTIRLQSSRRLRDGWVKGSMRN